MIHDLERASAREAVTEQLITGPPADKSEPDMVLWLHRALTVAATMGLIVGTRGIWQAHVLTRPWLALIITFAYLTMLIAAVVALTARSHHVLAKLDLVVLGTAVVIKAIASWPMIRGVLGGAAAVIRRSSRRVEWRV